MVLLLLGLAAKGAPINLRDDPRRDGENIAKITGACAAAGVVAVGGVAAVTAGVVTVLNRQDEVAALRKDNGRLRGAVNKMERKAQYESFS
jgi:hypothetical protein